ncbi:MAG TPA: hypothetical protein VK966_04040, partial [Longimicrobiales bacterium]|nr:hypothetical protein [Longimicrobiales bacterium]
MRTHLKVASASSGLALMAAAGLLACDTTGEDPPGPAWAAPDAPVMVLDTLHSPAPTGSAEPNVTTGPDGFYLSWLERLPDDRHALRFATLPGNGGPWSDPRTVLEREGLFVNWADFPSVLALEDGRVAAHWLQKSGPGTYAYDVRVAVSPDGGVTWGDDMIPHRDGQEAEHGFVSLFREADRVGAVWLDGRETVEGRPMTLRYTALDGSGSDPETLLDGSVCDCCQTAVALAADGPVVVYRDRTAEEIRDIHVVRRVNGEWSEPAPVHPDGWEIAACPVNGPAIDASDERVVVVWFTAAEPEGARVLAAFSGDGGATFGPPTRLDTGGAMGRVDVLMLDDGSALATWMERQQEGAGVLMRRIAADTVGPTIQLGATSSERASGFPRMARLGEHVLFAWTQAGDPPVVRTVL